jgi:hypothetical protein
MEDLLKTLEGSIIVGDENSLWDLLNKAGDISCAFVNKCCNGISDYDIEEFTYELIAILEEICLHDLFREAKSKGLRDLIKECANWVKQAYNSISQQLLLKTDADAESLENCLDLIRQYYPRIFNAMDGVEREALCVEDNADVEMTV